MCNARKMDLPKAGTLFKKGVIHIVSFGETRRKFATIIKQTIDFQQVWLPKINHLKLKATTDNAPGISSVN